MIPVFFAGAGIAALGWIMFVDAIELHGAPFNRLVFAGSLMAAGLGLAALAVRSLLT